MAYSAKAAPVVGWQFERDPAHQAAPATMEVACWTKTDHGRRPSLDVDSVNGIGEQPEDPHDAHAWASVQKRIEQVGRRPRA